MKILLVNSTLFNGLIRKTWYQEFNLERGNFQTAPLFFCFGGKRNRLANLTSCFLYFTDLTTGSSGTAK